MSADLKIRTYPEAQNALRENLTALQRSHRNEFSNEVIDRLVRYVFGSTEEGCFWGLINWFKTYEKHHTVWHAHYLGESGEAAVAGRSREVKSSLEQIKKGIDYFCGAGPILNDVLDLLDEHYRTRLNTRRSAGSVSLPLGCNLIAELRDTIKECQEEAISVIERGAPSKNDYLIEYLLAVFRHTFSAVPPTGNRGNTFELLAQAVLSACFYYEANARPLIVSALVSRVRNCVEAGRNLFEYAEATDSFVATEEMKAETSR